MAALSLLIAFGLVFAVSALFRRMRALEAEVARLEAMRPRAEAEPLAAPPPSIAAPPNAMPEPRVPPQAIKVDDRPDRERPNLESLVGGRLPIWIGGVALVLAGFFLVRFSIESGLLGPPARTILAAAFAAALIVASEAARRVPATAEDPRVAQALAGAGVASFYATLYMAAALYHLLPPLAAFVLMLAATALALALSLRHGPPTAVMALAGGFAAPLVAGFDAAGIGPLLVYLALFVAALFALAVRRGWGWLAIGATVAGFAWINFLLLALDARDLAGVGAFVVLLAAGASSALPATGLRDPWLRLVPLLAGFVQLVALAPALDFGALAWSFYLVLAGATLVLAWRERAFLAGAVAALALLLLLEGLALLQPERAATPLAAVAATLLFALPGHLLARRGASWAALAIGSTAGPLLVAHACAPALLPDSQWALLELIAAAAAASLAWRMRGEEQPHAVLFAATAAAALLAAIALGLLVPADWLALPLTLVALALAGWARFARAGSLFVLPALPLLAALVAAGRLLLDYANLIAETLGGTASIASGLLPYAMLPDPGAALRALAAPTLAAVALLLADSRQFGRARALVATLATVTALLLLYTLAKQPLAIATPAAFEAWSFVERALISQALLAAGWLLLRRDRAPVLGSALLLLGLFRIGWFDLLLLNPAIVAQAVGPLPLVNAAVLHAALAAAWLWTLPQPQRFRGVALGLALVAVLAAVRQAAHGTLLTGAVGNAENLGYSAALLGLALAWLWLGIRAASRTLRIAGLALLTLVTLKVFLVDAAALDGVLRILSFLGLGLALIGIGWAYSRFLGRPA